MGRDLPSAFLVAGARGTHPLFDPQSIRSAFERVDQGLLKAQLLLSAHHALRVLAGLGEFDLMRGFLAGLPEDTRHLTIYLYFRRLDRFLSRADRLLH